MLQEELANTMMHLKEESKAGCVLVQPSPTTCDPYDFHSLTLSHEN